MSFYFPLPWFFNDYFLLLRKSDDINNLKNNENLILK